MIRFSLFGVPVEIQPFFWVVCAILGGAIHADTPAEVAGVAIFMFASFISILIHELGHALVGRNLAGGHASIELNSFGGLAFNHGGRFNRSQELWMVAAGPGAGFLFLAAVMVMFGLAFGFPNAGALAGWELFGFPPKNVDIRLLDFMRGQPYVYEFLRDLLWINFWWGVINLLPVLPLDGGRITQLLVHPQRKVFMIGMIAAATMAVFGYFHLGSIYIAFLFGYLSWKNYQGMKSVHWQ